MSDGVTKVQLTDDGARPEGLPEKFASVADMASSYKELESRLTSQSTPEPTPESAPVTGKTKEPETLAPEVQSALDAIHEFNVTQRASRMAAQVGADGLQALSTYLDGPNIDPGMKAAYEAALASGNEALIEANFHYVRQAYENANGSLAPVQNVVAGADAGVYIPEGTAAFTSLAEQLAAQASPEYRNDPAVRAKVEQQIAISGPYPRV